jgi:WD40 repeat protein
MPSVDVQQWCVLVSCVEPSTEETCIHTLVQAGVSDKWTHDSQRFYWNSLTPSTTLLPRYTILPSHFALPHLGFTTPTPQTSQGRLKWSRGSQLDGEHVSAQLPWTVLPLGLAHWKDVIAVGLESGDIVTLDGITGSQVAVLSGHTGSVTSLSFSSDGALLVSGSMTNSQTLGYPDWWGCQDPLWPHQLGSFHFHLLQLHYHCFRILGQQFVCGTLGQESVIMHHKT